MSGLKILLQIAAGNFWGGGWQVYESTPGAFADRPRCGTATGAWTSANEPQAGFTGNTTSQAAAGWTATQIGSGYSTASAAMVRAVVDSNVPVELMRFNVE